MKRRSGEVPATAPSPKHNSVIHKHTETRYMNMPEQPSLPPEPVGDQVDQPELDVTAEAGQTITRSGRVSKPPQRLDL